jgi:hypothetical protein
VTSSIVFLEDMSAILEAMGLPEYVAGAVFLFAHLFRPERASIPSIKLLPRLSPSATR